MFLRIEGFQVEIKEINKTWNRADFIKNFKIGTNWNNISDSQENPANFSFVYTVSCFSQEQYI